MTIPTAAHAFYVELEQDKDWWQANRSTYTEMVEEPLKGVLQAGAKRFGGQVKLFRPHRDVRFSNDKRPLRTDAVGGLGSPDGPAIRYLRVDADGTVIGAGAPKPPREHLAAFRARLAGDPVAAGGLLDIFAKLENDGFELPDDPLRTAPRGYPADHPAIELLRRRSFGAERRLAPGALDNPDGAELIFATWTTLDPLVRWLEDAGATPRNR